MHQLDSAGQRSPWQQNEERSGPPITRRDSMQSRVLLLGRGGGAAARRRLRNIVVGPLSAAWGSGSGSARIRRVATAAGDTINIGDVQFKLKSPKNPELVPLKHMLDPMPQALAQHLRWIMQKDLLGQDVFLIGPPGPLRRSIAMQYLELTKREVEYMALSRDTTETDLKQRREIRAGTAFYIDQRQWISQWESPYLTFN